MMRSWRASGLLLPSSAEELELEEESEELLSESSDSLDDELLSLSSDEELSSSA